MKNISYTGYSIVKSAIRIILGLTLAAFLLCGCGRGSSGPTVRPGTTDEMWGDEVDDAEIYAFMYEGRVYTADTIDEINPYDATPYMKDGGFYKLTADVKYLNGGVAGYVNYPDIKSVSNCEEISPLDLHLPSITIYLNEYGKIGVWKDGSWIYRYDKSYEGEDGTLICKKSDVSEDTIKEGISNGVLSCEEYFVVPAKGTGEPSDESM